MDTDSTLPRLGKSGRRRRRGDDYPTPALNSAGLVLGLRKIGLKLPPSVLDCCGGGGQLARVVMTLEPGVDIKLTDFKPQHEAADLYATLAPVNARIMGDLKSALRIIGARAIVSNFPFGRGLFDPMLENALELLRCGAIDLCAVMQTEMRALNTDIGFRQTRSSRCFALRSSARGAAGCGRESLAIRTRWAATFGISTRRRRARASPTRLSLFRDPRPKTRFDEHHRQI